MGRGRFVQTGCDSGEFVGNLWAEGEGEGERGGEGKAEGGGGKREGEREEEEGGEGGRVLWALGGNLCLAFEGWGSHNHPFVTSRKR